MELYLLRHGIAERRATSGRDFDRALTVEGVEGVRRMMLEARQAGCAPAAIIASPYWRAQQTARIAAEVLGYVGAIHTSHRLTPDVAPADLWNEAREWERAPLLFVAHEPLLSAAAAWMTRETRVTVEFRPGTLVRIDFETVDRVPSGVVRWRLP